MSTTAGVADKMAFLGRVFKFALGRSSLEARFLVWGFELPEKLDLRGASLAEKYRHFGIHVVLYLFMLAQISPLDESWL